MEIKNHQTNCTCKPDHRYYGSGEVTLSIDLPFKEKVVGIDKCILPEIKDLWSKGIVTVASCCGHNRTNGFITVSPEHDLIMEKVYGYERYEDFKGHENGNIFTNTFKSKTCFIDFDYNHWKKIDDSERKEYGIK